MIAKFSLSELPFNIYGEPNIALEQIAWNGPSCMLK